MLNTTLLVGQTPTEWKVLRSTVTAADSLPVDCSAPTDDTVEVGKNANALLITVQGFSGDNKTLTCDVIGFPDVAGAGVRLDSLSFTSEATNWKTAASAYGTEGIAVYLKGFKKILVIITSLTQGESVDVVGVGI